MDSEHFSSPPTTTAALKAYYLKYGRLAQDTSVELIHFRDDEHIQEWLNHWRESLLPLAGDASAAGLQPLIGFSFYTWNAAEFLALMRRLKTDLPELLCVVGGPHVQQAQDYLGHDPVDAVVLGEGEVTFQQLLDTPQRQQWSEIPGLAFLHGGEILRTATRPRCATLDDYPSPLDVLELSDADGKPLYDSISYETSRGCPFRCAFCEWGTGAIGGKMYAWSLERVRDDWEKITRAGIANLWLADSNFGALKNDMQKAQLIVELKEKTGLPRSFATSWSKKHSRQVQEIALLLHKHQLLPRYHLALQTLTPEALRLSNRSNMSSNEYEPIAKRMSEQGVPIAAELIWGLPGDNLPDFERNLDRLLAVFPNINIFGYTLLPGTEFYQRREEYQIEAIPVAGYGKAKGEYVVGCHSFSREQGEDGYFLISAHILLLHGHIIPLTARLLALSGELPVSPLLRAVLWALVELFGAEIPDFDGSDRMQIYAARNKLYLAALAQPQRMFACVSQCVLDWLETHAASAELTERTRQLLQLDALLCPRTGSEITIAAEFHYDVEAVTEKLAAMELPGAASFSGVPRGLNIQHPGGVGEILFDADGGSWLCGKIVGPVADPQMILAIA